MPSQSQTEQAVAAEAKRFLAAYEREHDITMKLLRAFPPERADLRPHPRCRTARELAWVFVQDRGLGKAVFNDVFAHQPPSGDPPPAPERWEDVLSALEAAHREFGQQVARLSEAQLQEQVTFFTGPRTLGKYSRAEFAWFLLHDEIHHRGQFSIYLRMADAAVPSIYGPSGDEPWM